MSQAKVVVASYTCASIFKVPKGLDLEDKTQVRNWGVKWNKLTIELVDKSVITIEACSEAEIDYKYPCDEEINNAEDYNYGESDEEDEETKEEPK